MPWPLCEPISFRNVIKAGICISKDNISNGRLSLRLKVKLSGFQVGTTHEKVVRQDVMTLTGSLTL